MLVCDATDFSSEKGSVAIIVDKYDRVLKRIAVTMPHIVLETPNLEYNFDYTIKSGTGEQKIQFLGM